MEHRRNNQKFDYTISVADDVDLDETYISPLLLQPYVENAIWHGLSLKDERGNLSIVIKKNKTSLLCIIEDDGIGRKKSAETNLNSLPKTSLAMNISSQRIAWLQQDEGLSADVTIIDKFKENVATGTRVLLTLPLIIKET